MPRYVPLVGFDVFDLQRCADVESRTDACEIVLQIAQLYISKRDQIFLDQVYAGLTGREAATLLGVSPAFVSKRSPIILKRLRLFLWFHFHSAEIRKALLMEDVSGLDWDITIRLLKGESERALADDLCVRQQAISTRFKKIVIAARESRLPLLKDFYQFLYAVKVGVRRKQREGKL